MWCCARSLLRSCGVISHTRAPPTCLEICCVFSVLYAKLFTVGECMCFEPCTPGAAISFIIQCRMCSMDLSRTPRIGIRDVYHPPIGGAGGHPARRGTPGHIHWSLPVGSRDG